MSYLILFAFWVSEEEAGLVWTEIDLRFAPHSTYEIVYLIALAKVYFSALVNVARVQKTRDTVCGGFLAAPTGSNVLQRTQTHLCLFGRHWVLFTMSF